MAQQKISANEITSVSSNQVTTSQWTTAGRPVSPTLGQQGWNTTISALECWTGSGWSSLQTNYSVLAALWGGGGGGGGASNGGGAGATTGTINLISGVSYPIVVGGGGLNRPANTNAGPPPAGGGGLAGNLGFGGQGGGYSGIFLNSVALGNSILIAGGGGGGSYDSAGINGGVGGGLTGGAGGSALDAGGGGGTQTSGGSSVSQAGSALQGGSTGSQGDAGGGGGGGGGYFGGGGGSNTNPGAAGGGGSGYFNPFVTSAVTLYTGSGTTPGNSGSSLRGTSGNGGVTTSDGVQGIVVIYYLGAQRGSGGTVTSSGGYTYHTFTSSGTFTA